MSSPRSTYARAAIGALALALVVGAVVWWSSRPREVEVYAVTARDVSEVYVVTGTTRARTSSVVSVAAPGRVETVRVEAGDEVQKGDVLAELRTLEAQLALEQAQAQAQAAEHELERTKRGPSAAQRRSAQARVERARVDLNNAARVLARSEDLLGRGLATQADRDQAAHAVAQRRADLALAQAQQRELLEQPRPLDVEIAQRRRDQARASLRAVEAELDKTVVRAPFAGLITEVSASPGEHLQTGQAVARVASREALEVVAQVREDRISALSAGMEAACVLAAWPEQRLKGRVRRVGPEVDAALGVVTVRVEVDGLPKAAVPGLTADVALMLRRVEGARAVPRRALLGAGDDAAVLRLRDGRAQRVPVRVLAEGEDHVAVSGVELGEVLVLDATQTAEGDAVTAKGAP